MKIKLTITIMISKFIIYICRVFGLGGTTLPGKVAYKIYPEILDILSKDFQTIVITGTNGKTTTSKIIGRILKENNIHYIANTSGANLISGIISTFVEAVNFNGQSSLKTAVIECDEASFTRVSEYLKPGILVVTNFFRDQLDRYGELYGTLKCVANGIVKTEKTKLILNADDPLCASLGKNANQNVFYYGFEAGATENIIQDNELNSRYCIYCQKKYDYSYQTYSHLGGFFCTNCGYHRPDSQVSCIDVIDSKKENSYIEFKTSDDSSSYTTKINLPGIYNIYNALAAITCGITLKLSIDSITKALQNFEASFGRMETIHVADRIMKLILVKNPAGFNQVIDSLSKNQNKCCITMAVNDNPADGIDVSWIWDVTFEKLLDFLDKIDRIDICGTRKEDLALRLNYAGIPTNKISIDQNYSDILKTQISQSDKDCDFYILPTYTAMLDIRKCLKTKFKLKEFWK